MTDLFKISRRSDRTVVLVTVPALWILRRRGCPIVAGGRLELEATR
jgi:hypothetical protein